MNSSRLPVKTAFRLIISAIALIFLFTPPFAAASSGWEIAPFAALHLGGSFEDNTAGVRFDAGAGPAFGLIIAIPDKVDTRYELLYAFQRTDFSAKGGLFGGGKTLDLDIHYLHIGGSYKLMEGKLQPFVSGGLGITHFAPNGSGQNSKTHFSASLGVGAIAPLSRFVSLRVEGRGFLTILPENTTVFCVSDGGVACSVKAQGDLFGQFLLMVGIVFSL